jgi:esterase/lipase superfamily enzyme
MTARPCLRGLLGLLAAVALVPAGCQQQELIATPNLLLKQDPEHVFAACPANCQGPDMDVLYATDRESSASERGIAYGSGRARRLAFGVATVSLRPESDWKELIANSTRAERRPSYALAAPVCKERGSFDPRLERLEPHGNSVHLAADTVSDMTTQQQQFHGMLADRLAAASQKDVYIFVHGFNNTFDDAVYRAAAVWHFLGRVGVPVVYSWPAGFGGIRGYAHDRESGEFTVFHLKYFLQMVASCPGVERVHLVAHSRGCDVAITALRELHIACRASGKDTQAELKLENLVLAAPDLDQDVFMQRFVAENLTAAAHRTTIYASTSDAAIELADLVFGDRRRVGNLGPQDFSPQVRQLLAKMPNVQFIDCKVSHYSSSHDYVFAHPAALSDLILVLRDRRDPGAANGRPLIQPVEGLWELTNDYPSRRK